MPEIKPKIHTIYYNDSSQIHVKFRTVGGKKHGLYRTWSYNGHRRSRMTYKNDLLHGKEITWHSNGQKEFELNWIHGYADGPAKSWHRDGKLAEEIIYSNGNRHGMERSWDKNGGLTLERYFENGRECWRRCWDQEGNLTLDGAPRKAPIPIPRTISLVAEYHENIKNIKKKPLARDNNDLRPQ